LNSSYRNIFFYYRDRERKSHLTGDQLSARHDVQLEDNTTKALINTLELSCENKDVTVLRHFLFNACGLNNIIFDSARFELQRGKETSKPDAHIYLYGTKNYIVILIESKLKASLEKEQLKRHLKEHTPDYLLAITDKDKDDEIIRDLKNPKVKHITWKKIYDSMGELEPNKLHPVSKLLVNQFKEFLAMNGITIDPYACTDNASRISLVRKLAGIIQDRINKDNRFSKKEKNDLIAEKKYSNYPGMQLGRNAITHYNINYEKDSIDINLTFFGIKMADNRKEIHDFLRNILNKVGHITNNKVVSKEQSLLMRYYISAMGYRSKTKGQSDPGFTTFEHTLNLYELRMNHSKKKEQPLLNGVFDSYEIANKVGTAKQLNLGFKIDVPEKEKAKRLEKAKKNNDIRVLNYQLISDQDKLIDALLKFIYETKHLLKH